MACQEALSMSTRHAGAQFAKSTSNIVSSVLNRHKIMVNSRNKIIELKLSNQNSQRRWLTKKTWNKQIILDMLYHLTIAKTQQRVTSLHSPAGFLSEHPKARHMFLASVTSYSHFEWQQDCPVNLLHPSMLSESEQGWWQRRHLSILQVWRPEQHWGSHDQISFLFLGFSQCSESDPSQRPGLFCTRRFPKQHFGSSPGWGISLLDCLLQPQVWVLDHPLTPLLVVSLLSWCLCWP